MGQRLIDDNSVVDFMDDSVPSVFCFVDDLDNFTCEPPVLWAQSCMSILVACALVEGTAPYSFNF
jgi:hypothetical protein